eukprot:s2514_g7.t1
MSPPQPPHPLPKRTAELSGTDAPASLRLSAKELAREKLKMLQQYRAESKGGTPEADGPQSLVPTLTKPKTVELEAGALVWKRNQDGILVWDVELVKRSETDKYGFSHSSGKAEYLKSIGVAENTPEVDGPQVLFIRKIGLDGLLCWWNEAHGDSVVQPGDRIDKVNGKANMDQMAQELQHKAHCMRVQELRGDKVRLEVHRYPEEFEVSLSKKASPKLGFKFEKPSNEKFRELKITEIGREGALPDRNRQMANAGRFHYVVAMGMRIIKVNSVEGDAFQMKEDWC